MILLMIVVKILLGKSLNSNDLDMTLNRPHNAIEEIVVEY